MIAKPIATQAGKLVFALMCLVLATGCIREDLTDCDNFRLSFTYAGDEGAEVAFADKITKVDLLVFDDGRRCVAQRTLSSAELQAQTATFRLTPGNYHAIAVGNAYEATALSYAPGAAFSAMHMECIAGHPLGRITSADPLYLASKPFSVLKGEKQVVELPFEASHIDVYVEVRGLLAASARAEVTPAPPLPLLEMTHLPQLTDFTNRPSSAQLVSHFPDGVVDADRLVYRFNVMRSVAGSEICLTDLSGEELYRLSVDDFLARHPQIDLTRQEAVLPVCIEFRNAQVVVTVPDWTIEGVKPDF